MNNLEIAENIILKAGEKLLAFYYEQEKVILSQEGRDIKAQADSEMEAFIRSEIRKEIPDASILGEELGDESFEELTGFVIDPIDGTMNFSRTNPIFCISVGYVENGEPIWGLIYNPVLKELIKGSEEGLFLNGNSFTRENITDPKKAVLSTGIPTYLNIDDNGFFQYLSTIKTFKKIRMVASAAQSVA